MTRHIHKLLAALLVTLSALLPVQSGSAQKHEPLLVIVGRSTGITDISLAMLRRAFQGEAAVLNGKRLVPLNHAPGTGERKVFDRAVLGLEPGDVGRFWINRRIRDEGLPPRTLPSADLAVRIVASFPGAITYFSAGMLNTNNTSVRVLKIDGKGPNDPGYLLASP